MSPTPTSGALPRIDYAEHPYYGGMLQPHRHFARQAMEVLQPLIDEMTAVEQERQALFGYRRGHAEAIGEELARDGVSRVQLAPAAMDRVGRLAAPVVAEVQQRLAATRAAGDPVKYKTALEPFSAETSPELWSAVDDAVRDAGMLEITRTLFGASAAKLRSAAVLVNQPDQDWATRLYRDIDAPAPPTAGFHIDSNGRCFVKAVLYLTDVDSDQGPFGMIPGSHLWDEGSQDRIYRRAFDKSGLVIRSLKKRRQFLSLPREMQVKAEFGGDMLAGAPETEALLAQEHVALGPRGQLNLFDPEAIHRGGNVRQGERQVLLITAAPSQW